jgi:hypothetical protein
MENAMQRAITLTIALLGGALFVAAVLLGSVLVAAIVVRPAFAQNLGDVPANHALDARCPETSYLGPMVTGYCTDRNNLMIKSRIDVHHCAGYALTVDASGRLRCRGR